MGMKIRNLPQSLLQMFETFPQALADTSCDLSEAVMTEDRRNMIENRSHQQCRREDVAVCI